MTEPNSTATETIIMAYWKSWQNEDWDAMRASLAERMIFGGHPMEREQFVQMCQQGNPWKDVTLVDSLFNDQGGALIYDGTDSKSGQRIRVAEIIRVEGGRVSGAHACFGSATPPQ